MRCCGQLPTAYCQLCDSCNAESRLWVHHCAALRVFVQDIKFNVHAHPTVSEVIEVLVHQAHLEKPKTGSGKPVAKQAVAA